MFLIKKKIISQCPCFLFSDSIYLFLNGNKEMFMIFVVTQYHLLVVIIVESGGNKN